MLSDSQSHRGSSREKLPTPVLPHVASPSPAKARRRQATERPSLPTANVAPVKLPSELFAIATSRSSQGDLALSKALDGIQAAATRLETERTKLVIQSQELQIWDMAREEELVLLRAENELLEQQLAGIADKVGKGLGRDSVLDGLQFALRKARQERDAEMQEADSLFNQLQESKAAAMELSELRAALTAALSGLSDEWSAVPLVSEEARELRGRAEAAALDPTNLGGNGMATLVRGLLALASRGAELQQEVQTLSGEKAALQQALDAAHQQLADQTAPREQELGGGAAGHDIGFPREGAADRGTQSRLLPADSANRLSGSEPIAPGHVHGEEQTQQQLQPEAPSQVAALQVQVLELQMKLEEYRSYLAENQEEIEQLQGEVKRLHQAQVGHEAGRLGRRSSASGARVPPGPQAAGVSGSAASAVLASVQTADGGVAWRRQAEQQQQQMHGPRLLQVSQKPQPVVGTPTRHVPSASSPISTVNYGASPPIAASPPIRGSPMSQQAAADIALKVAELQELALRAQQQAVKREADLVAQHEAQLEAARQQMATQHAAGLAEVQAREVELAAQHSITLAGLEAQTARQAVQHAAELAELHAQVTKLTSQHAQALAGREAVALQKREEELAVEHGEALARLVAAVEARAAEAMTAAAAEAAAERERALRAAEGAAAASLEQRLRELEQELAARFTEQQTIREAEARHKHAERLAEQAAQLAQLHAEQAAQLGIQHAEAIADRETELQSVFERRMAEREAELAGTHAEQLREVETRLAAQAAEAAALREAHLERQIAELLAEARQQQQALQESLESLAAAQAAAKAAAEARQQVVRVEALAAERCRDLERARERAVEAEGQLEDARQLAGERAAQLEEQRRQMEELQQQLLAVQIATAAAAAEPAAHQRQQQEPPRGTESDPGAATSSHDDTASGAGDDSAEGGRAAREGGDGDGCEAQVRRLARQGEQLQRHVDELEADLAEAKRRRGEAVAAVERQYVEVVARLGRQHEKAVAEARAVHELREENLRRALERRAQESREAEARHAEQLNGLQAELSELRHLLREERERHNSSSAALEERAARLALELVATRRREAEVLREFQGSRRPDSPRRAGEKPASAPAEDAQARDAAGSPPWTGHEARAASTAAGQATAATDVWTDGQALLWPATASGSDSRSNSTMNGIGVGGDAGCAGPAQLASARAPTPATEPAQQADHEGDETGVARRSDQDLAANLLRVMRVLESDNAGAPGTRRCDGSVELDLRAAPRQELLRECAASPLPPGGGPSPQASEVAPAQGLNEAAALRVGLEEAAKETGAGEVPAPTWDAAAGFAPGSGEVRRGLESAEWSELFDAEPASAVPQRAETLLAGVATSASSPAAAAGGCPGPVQGDISEAATCVSTDTEYNSETEFCVDDEDDEEHRGQALAAALAQSPSAAQANLPRLLPLPPAPMPLGEPLRRRGPQTPTTHGSPQANGASSGGNEQATIAAAAAGKGPVHGATGGAEAAGSGTDGSSGLCGAAGVLMGLASETRLRASEASSRDATAATPQHSLEATLSGPFPMLLSLPPPSVPHRRPPPPPPVVPGHARTGDSGEDDTVVATSGGSPAQLPPRQPAFSFSELQRAGPDWDGVPIGGGNPFAGTVGEPRDSRRRPSEIAQLNPPLIDLTASFDFSIGAQVLRPKAATATVPAQTTEVEESGVVACGPALDGSSSVQPGSAAGRQTDGAQQSRQGGSSSTGAESSGSSSDNGGELGSGVRAGGHDGDGSPSSSVPKLPPLLPRSRPQARSTEQRVGGDPTDDGKSSLDGDVEGADGGSDTEHEPVGGDEAGKAGAPFGAAGERVHDAKGVAWPPPPPPTTAPASVTPLLLPNPLFEDGGEVSPPWSAADWNAAGVSPPGQLQAAQYEGLSLPSTPGSESNRGGSSGDGNDGSSSGSSTDGAPWRAVSARGTSYGAWNALYDLPYEASPPGWDASSPGPEQTEQTESSDELRTCSDNGSSESHGSLPRRPMASRLEEDCHAHKHDHEASRRGRPGDGPHLLLREGQAAKKERDGDAAAPSGGRRDGSGQEAAPVEGKAEGGSSEDDGDDMRSLLAAGATLSSAERRRRHRRRRMGDAPAALAHPIDLLRQGWEFSGGLASPISPRSAGGCVVSSPLEPTAASTATTANSTDDSWMQSPLGRGVERPSPSPESQQRQRQAALLQLLPLHAQQRSDGSGSPVAVARRVRAGVGTSSPSPRSSPFRPSAGGIGAQGGDIAAAGADSPRVPSRSTGVASGVQPAAAAAESTSSRGVPWPLTAAAPGPFAIIAGSPTSFETSDRVLSPMEARQRSRTVLGRAQSRVAELEGQCRALVASGYPDVPDDDVAAAAATEVDASPAARPRSPMPDRRGGPADCDAAKCLSPQKRAELTAAGSGKPRSSSCALVMAPSQAAPAEVVGALEELHGDLSELEALLSVRAAAKGADGGVDDGATLPEPRPAVLLLAGLAGGAVAAAAAAAAASAERASAASPRRVGAPPEAVGGRGPQPEQVPESPCAGAGAHAAVAMAVASAASPGEPPSDSRTPLTVDGRPVGGIPRAVQISATEPRAGKSDTAAPTATPVATWNPAAAGDGVGAGARTPWPVSSSSLDPSLMAMLQVSIQAQLQGQLGPLEAKIAELQRQNQALLAAATAASTPATPLQPPSALLAFRYGAAAVAATPLTGGNRGPGVASAATTTAGCGATELGAGRQADAAGVTPRSSGCAAIPWADGGGGLWMQTGQSGGGTCPPREARPVFPAAWEPTPTPSPAATAASGALHGHASMSVYPNVRAPAAAVLLSAAATAQPPAQAGVRRPAVWTDSQAGPYSPEELSQLPPAVQIFAPPQLRAAALEAAREPSQNNRRSL